MTIKIRERVVEVFIDRITVDGLGTPNRARLLDAITRELESRIASGIASGDEPKLFRETREVERLDGGEARELRGAKTTARLGEQIGASVDRALRSDAPAKSTPAKNGP